MVPVEVADLARLEADAAGGAVGVVELGDADVDVEGLGDGLAGGDGNLFQHKAAGLGADGDDGGVLAAERDGDAVVALGDGDGEEEGLVGRADAVGDGGGGLQVEAGGGVGG